MKRLWLFLKGTCMGASDVIPGVSGGTMALILGIYRKLVKSIEGLNLRWIPPLWRWVTDGRQPQDWRAFVDALEEMNLGFLAILGAGILTAIAVGGVIIPELMEQYPVAMRAFFFGLILASVWVPYRMMDLDEASMTGVAAILMATAIFGFVATSPSHSMEATQTWTTLESSGETIERLTRRGPSAASAYTVFWADNNEPLREAIQRDEPDTYQTLQQRHEDLGAIAPTDKDALKKRSKPYRTLVVPAGTRVDVPRPARWFIFLAGATAICAMILPGISGSYILLILGTYFFVLNAIKGSIESVIAGQIPLQQGSFVALFAIGAFIGLLSFARLLGYLLDEYSSLTLAGLIGLMVGCLRGIWPFRAVEGGVSVNTWPATFDAQVVHAMAAFLVGITIVATLTYFGAESDSMETTQ